MSPNRFRDARYDRKTTADRRRAWRERRCWCPTFPARRSRTVRGDRDGQVRRRPKRNNRHGRNERGRPGDREERPQAGAARPAAEVVKLGRRVTRGCKNSAACRIRDDLQEDRINAQHGIRSPYPRRHRLFAHPLPRSALRECTRARIPDPPGRRQTRSTCLPRRAESFWADRPSFETPHHLEPGRGEHSVWDTPSSHPCVRQRPRRRAWAGSGLRRVGTGATL
jgi:hypothetical protein